MSFCLESPNSLRLCTHLFPYVNPLQSFEKMIAPFLRRYLKVKLNVYFYAGARGDVGRQGARGPMGTKGRRGTQADQVDLR